MSQMSEMSRGEMIRRLDDAFVEVRDHLANGPLSTNERHALATSLSRLLPIVADSLQEQEDADAAKALVRHADPTTMTSPRNRHTEDGGGVREAGQQRAEAPVDGVALVRRIYEAFNVRDIDCVVALTHPDIEVHPLRTQSVAPIRGRACFREWLQDGIAAGRMHPYEIEQVHALEDGAVVLVGNLVEHETSIDMIGVHRLKDGLSWRVHQYFSDEATLDQLGLLNTRR
jgi:ketosteroid isomerase-like protein